MANTNSTPEWSPVAAVRRPEFILCRRRRALLFAQLFEHYYPTWAERCNGRIERAVELCSMAGACRRGDLPGVFQVQSESNPRGSYTVDMNARTCSCPDFGRQPAGRAMCKHLLAIGFHLHGPAWIRRFEDELFQLKNAYRQAWEDQLEAGDLFEYLAVSCEGVRDIPDEEIEAARTRMYEATAAAVAAQKAYDAFHAEYLALFYPRHGA